jgi:hypothetical protein
MDKLRSHYVSTLRGGPMNRPQPAQSGWKCVQSRAMFNKLTFYSQDGGEAACFTGIEYISVRHSLSPAGASNATATDSYDICLRLAGETDIRVVQLGAASVRNLSTWPHALLMRVLFIHKRLLDKAVLISLQSIVG